MKNKEIISAIVGGTFFAIPYLVLSAPLAPALIVSGAAFGASELILSSVKGKETLKETNYSLYQKITKAKKENKEIVDLIPKVNNEELRSNLSSINETVTNILEVVEKEPKKAKKLNNFFDYYLPVLIKIVQRYDEIEDDNLTSEESKNFMRKANKMIGETKTAFESILSSLYQNDIVDADAEMKVYDLMLKADGIVGDNLMKGEDNEK